MECDYNCKVELVRNDDTVVQEDIDGVPERKVEDSSGSVEGLLVGGLCKVMDYWRVGWNGTGVYNGMGSLQTSALVSSNHPQPHSFHFAFGAVS